MSETLEPGRPTPAFPEAIRQFREDIGGGAIAIPQTLPRASRTLPRLLLKSGRSGKLVIVLGLLVMMMAGLYVVPRMRGPDPVPTQLVGSWATDDTRYAGRHLELTSDALILRASAKDRTEYAVQRVQRQATAQGSAYVISTHSEAAGDYILMLEYQDAQQTIALGKPARGLWRRTR